MVHGVATAAGCQLVASCDLAGGRPSGPLRHPRRRYRPVLLDPDRSPSRVRCRPQGGWMTLLTGEIDRRRAPPARSAWSTRSSRMTRSTAAYSLARHIAAKVQLTLAMGEAFHRQAEMDLDSAYRYASEVMTRNMQARDAAEGIDAFLAKRTPVWSGS
jgi:hypothetical protein